MSEGADHTLSTRMRQLAFFLAVVTCAAALHAKTPRVVLFLVVDQFIPAYMDFPYENSGGIKRFRDKAAWYTNARYIQVPTETAPGHATLLTGRPPSQTGIVGNDWFDRHAQSEIISTAPGLLLSPTLGDLMKEKNPRSIVVAISGKERSSRMMAGAKADFLDWHFLKEDLVISRAAQKEIVDWKIGEDEVPDLVAISFSVTDRVGHKFGPDSTEMKDNLRHLDDAISELLTFCEKKFGRDGFIAVLSSDHGVLSMPESEEGRRAGIKRINKNNLRSNIEKSLEQAFPGQTNLLIKMMLPDLYLDMSKINSIETARAAVGRVQGIAEAYAPPFEVDDEFNDAYKRSYFPGRSGDLLVRLEKNTLALAPREGTGHSSPYEYDSHVPVVFWGEPFKQGRYTRPVNTLDIVPTLAVILELAPLIGSEGKPLMDAIGK